MQELNEVIVIKCAEACAITTVRFSVIPYSTFRELKGNSSLETSIFGLDYNLLYMFAQKYFKRQCWVNNEDYNEDYLKNEE